MISLFKKLYKAGLVDPAGLRRMFGAFLNSGLNLIALLRFSASRYPTRIAIVDDNEELTYQQLYDQVQQLAATLKDQYDIVSGSRVSIIARNHASLIRSIFAVAQTGADLWLLSTDMSPEQCNKLVQKNQFNLVILDDDLLCLDGLESRDTLSFLSINKHSAFPSQIPAVRKTSKVRGGKIIVLTGGTTGEFKSAARKPSYTDFLNPFLAVIDKCNIHKCKSVLIATPVYHGFGLASVFISVLLGTKMFLQQKFDADKACSLIQQYNIESATLVPLMLHRMLQKDRLSLSSLQCIISGGAPLCPALVKETQSQLGNNLFNLYGTSEAGFSLIATPEDLAYSASTCGKPIRGVNLNILNNENRETATGSVGRICIRSKWTAGGKGWTETGDVGYRDANGYYFLCGRVDDMIISGGENVYPLELERILAGHHQIKQAAVVGIPDQEFGQRLKAFVVPINESYITREELTHWLSTSTARYQMPRQIEFVSSIPSTALGKVDKKVLV